MLRAYEMEQVFYLFSCNCLHRRQLRDKKKLRRAFRRGHGFGFAFFSFFLRILMHEISLIFEE